MFGGGDAEEAVLLGEEVVDQFLLERQQFVGASTEGSAVTDLVVAGVEIPQHQIDGIEPRGMDAGGRNRIHHGPSTQGVSRS